MKIIKLALKVLILSLAIISAKIDCTTPDLYWFGKKADKCVVILQNRVPTNALPNFKSDSSLIARVTSELMKFIYDLSITIKSNFITTIPFSEVKEVNEGYERVYKNLSEYKDIQNAVFSLAMNSQTFNNMTFLKYNHDQLDRLNTVNDCIVDILSSPGSEICRSLSTISFSEYFKYLQESKNIFFKYIEEQDFKAETKNSINSWIQRFDVNLKEFKSAITLMIKLYESQGIELTLANFLMIFDSRTEREGLSFFNPELKQSWHLMKPGLKKNWQSRLKQMLWLNDFILQSLILKEILISTNNKNLTISYLLPIHEDILRILKLEFKTIDDVCMPPGKYIVPNKEMLNRILANLSSPDLITGHSSSASSSTITTSRSDLLSIYKDLIKKEIDENEHLSFIKDCLQDSKIEIEQILFDYKSLNTPLPGSKLTLLMLAASITPSSSALRLINMLLEFGANSSINIEDNKTNQDDISPLIHYTPMAFAKLLKSDDIVALLELDFDTRSRLKELAKLNDTGDLLNKCGNCDKKPVSHCKQCKKLNYCSRDCQEKHWKEVHKKDCKALKASAKIDLSIFLVPEEKSKAESSSKTGATIPPPDKSVSAESDPNLAAANSAASLAAARSSVVVAAAAAAIAATRPTSGPSSAVRTADDNDYDDYDIDEKDKGPGSAAGSDGASGSAGAAGSRVTHEENAEELFQQALRESMASTKSSAAKSGISASIAGGSLSSHSSSVHTSREESKEVKVEVDLARSTAIEQPMKPSKARSKERPMKSSRSISGRFSVKASLERPTAAASVPALSGVSAAQPSSAATEQLAKLESARKASILAKPKVTARPAVAEPSLLKAVLSTTRPTAVTEPKPLSLALASKAPTSTLPTTIAKPIVVSGATRPMPVAAAAAAIAAAIPSSAAAETPTTLEVDHGNKRVGKWTKHVGRSNSNKRKNLLPTKLATPFYWETFIARNSPKPKGSGSTGRTKPEHTDEEKAMAFVNCHSNKRSSASSYNLK